MMTRTERAALNRQIKRMVKRSPKNPRIKLARAIIAETDDILAGIRENTANQREANLRAYYARAQSHVRMLRHRAQMEWLDDKIARHRIHIAEAKRLEKHLPAEYR
jgi:hypothetical protein